MSVPHKTPQAIPIRLGGHVTLHDVCAHVGDVWRKARTEKGLLFTLDCAAVKEFSYLALTALGRLQRHLRQSGCDLFLINCSLAILGHEDAPLMTRLVTPADPRSLPAASLHPRCRRGTAASITPPHFDPDSPRHRAFRLN